MNILILILTYFFIPSTDITGSAFNKRVVEESSFDCYDLNLKANILKSRITPMFIGGIGLIKVWGISAGSMWAETDFSYNVGSGFRWDATNHLLIKGMYSATRTKLKDTDEKIMPDGISVWMGYIF